MPKILRDGRWEDIAAGEVNYANRGQVVGADKDTLLGKGWNIGVDALQGVVDVPAAAAGLAGLVPGVNQVADPIYAGLQTLSKGIGDTLHTQPWLNKEAELAAAAATPGIMNSAGATLDFLSSNPSQILGSVARSIPSMLGGGYLGKAATLGKAGAGTAAMVGEGLIGAGAAAGEIGQHGNGEYNLERLMGVPIGVATGMIAKGASKLMPDALDVDTAMARLAGNSALSGADKEAGGLVTRSLKGLFKEGILEELPQSVQETALQNVAMGKPWDEGVGSAAVTGALTGGLMGGGYSAVGGGLRNLRIAQLEQEAQLARARDETEKARLFQEEADRLKAEVEFERAQQNPAGALEALQEQTRRQAAIDAAMAGQDQAIADRNEVFSQVETGQPDLQAALEALSEEAQLQRGLASAPKAYQDDLYRPDLGRQQSMFPPVEEAGGVAYDPATGQVFVPKAPQGSLQDIAASLYGTDRSQNTELPLTSGLLLPAPQAQPTKKGKSNGRQKTNAIPAQVQETGQGQSQAEPVRQDAGQGQNAHEGLLTPPAKPVKPPSKSEQVLLDAVANQDLTAAEAAEIRKTYAGRGAKGIPKAVSQVIEAKATAAARAQAVKKPESVRTLAPEVNPLLAGMTKVELKVAQHLLESPGALDDRGNQLAVDLGISEASASTALDSAVAKLKTNAETLYGEDAQAKLTEAFGGVDPTTEVEPETVVEAAVEDDTEDQDDTSPVDALANPGDKNARSGAYVSKRLAKGFDTRAAAAGKSRRWADLSQIEKLTLSDLHESLNQWSPEAQATKEGAAEYIAEKKALRAVEDAMMATDADESVRIQSEDAALRDAERTPLKTQLTPDQERQNKAMFERIAAEAEEQYARDVVELLEQAAGNTQQQGFSTDDAVYARSYWEELQDALEGLPNWSDLPAVFKFEIMGVTRAADQAGWSTERTDLAVEKAYEAYRQKRGVAAGSAAAAGLGTDAVNAEQTLAEKGGTRANQDQRSALRRLEELKNTKEGRAKLDQIMVTHRVWNDTSSSWEVREMSALKAMEDVESDLTALRDFKLCLGG